MVFDMAIIRWVLSIIFAAIVVVFALHNRGDISIMWNPLSAQGYDVPLYLFGLICLLAGFLWGGFLVWMGGWTKRREVRRQAKAIRKLEGQLDKVNSQSGSGTSVTLA